jgi:tRNA(Ile2) C34 agmatinyltransferase TiaS
MKGPSGRLKFDVRRQWQCPRCGHHDSSAGQVVNYRCPNCQEPTWMILQEENVKPKPELADLPHSAAE